jgi:hypothetical protein
MNRPVAPSAQPGIIQTKKPWGWETRVLTSDYVVTGFLEPTPMGLTAFLNAPNQTTVTLASVTLKAIRPGVPTISETLPEISLPKTSIIAFIPLDDNGAKSATINLPQRTLRALMYFGAYLIRGAFMVGGNMPLANFYGAVAANFVPVTKADIFCQVPGSDLAEMKAEIMVVNKMYLQLFHPVV